MQKVQIISRQSSVSHMDTQVGWHLMDLGNERPQWLVQSLGEVDFLGGPETNDPFREDAFSIF